MFSAAARRKISLGDRGMDAISKPVQRFRLRRVLECLLLLAGTSGLALYTYSCQAPFSWSGVIGEQHWAEMSVQDGDLGLVLLKLHAPTCLESLVDRMQGYGYSVLMAEDGCMGWHYRFQHAVVLFVAPDWLFDACDSTHQPASTLIVRLPIAYSAIALLLIPVVIRGWLAARKLLRSTAYLCTECGYPLQGLPILRCPECGQR